MAEQPFKGVDGSTWFTDAGGRSVGEIPLDPQLHLAPGQAGSQHVVMAGLGKLVEADRADLSAITCVESIVTTAGATKSFE